MSQVSSRGQPLSVVALVIVALIALCFSSMRNHDDMLKWTIYLYDMVNSLDDATVFNTQENPYLIGEFEPVSTEKTNLTMITISGSMPSDISGLFMRIGPNQIPGHFSRRYHLFDGHGMIHSVRIKRNFANSNLTDFTASYSNQYLKTPRYELERKLNRSVFMLIGELRGLVGLVKVLVLSPLLNYVLKTSSLTIGQANTAILFYKNKLYAGHEGSLPFEFMWDDEKCTFESIGYETLGSKLDFAVTAHSKVNPFDGGWYFNGYSPADQRYPMKYGYINSSMGLTSYFGIASPVINFAHDFSITKKYALLVQSSILFSPEKIMDGIFFDFSPSHKLKIGVVPKAAQSSDSVKWFTANEPLAMVHVMTSWDEETPNGEEVVLWAPLSAHFDGSFKIHTEFYLHEIRMNMDTGAMTITKVEDSNQMEFPKVHPSYTGRKAKFGFGNKFDIRKNDEKVLNFHGIIKYNLFEKKVAAILVLDDQFIFSGECIPIPKASIASNNHRGDFSDAVYLAAFVINSVTRQTEWHVYDGESMESTPLVRLLVPARVPTGFHAEWLSEQQLQMHISRRLEDRSR